MCVKVNRPTQLSMTINTQQFYFSDLFGSTCSRKTHFKPYIAHTGYYTTYSITFISITLNIEEEGLEREGNVAVCSLCVYGHTCTYVHSLNKSKTKHRILNIILNIKYYIIVFLLYYRILNIILLSLKDNTGKSIKLS